MTGLFPNPSTTTHSFPSHNRHLLHSRSPYSPKMPMFALPGILGGLGLAIRITGELYECFVVNGGCRIADLPTDNTYKVEDLAASVIPALNETVMMRAESEGLLAAAANTGPCGVPQYNFDMCSADVRRVTVRTSLPAAGGTYPTPFFCRLSAMCLLASARSRPLRQRPGHLHGPLDGPRWRLRRCAPLPARLRLGLPAVHWSQPRPADPAGQLSQGEGCEGLNGLFSLLEKAFGQGLPCGKYGEFPVPGLWGSWAVALLDLHSLFRSFASFLCCRASWQISTGHSL